MKAYHGVTIMSASLTGLPVNHNGFDLPVDGVLHTDCPHFYRYGLDGETESEFTARMASALRELIEREDPDTVAAMIAEPVMGAGGVIVPPKGYFPAIKEILDEFDIMLIDDEVINGFCRTGNWWGCQTHDMVPTTLSAAKQMTSAYAPLGAVMVPDDIYQAYVDHSSKLGTFGHGFTYGGHPLGCAVGVKAIEIYQKRDILGHVRTLMPVFERRMNALTDHPLVGEARFSGLMGGVEIVADKKTKQPFPPEHGVAAKVSSSLEKRGAILRPLGETIALCPPMIIREDELNTLFDRLEKALDDAEAYVVAEGLRS